MTPADPFRFAVELPAGVLAVEALPGRAASVRAGRGPTGALPLLLDGARFAFSATARRGAEGWVLEGAAAIGDPGTAPDPDALAAALLPGLAAALDARVRRFVERDLLDVLAARRAGARARAQVEAEIARRQAKLRDLEAEAAAAEPGLVAREAALMAEIAALGPDADPPAPAPAARRDAADPWALLAAALGQRPRPAGAKRAGAKARPRCDARVPGSNIGG